MPHSRNQLEGGVKCNKDNILFSCSVVVYTEAVKRVTDLKRGLNDSLMLG